MLTALKDHLPEAGPDRAVVFQAFRLQALMRGIWLKRAGGAIVMTRGKQRVLLNSQDAISIPFVMHLWDQFFDSAPVQRDGYTVLDFSKPALHGVQSSDKFGQLFLWAEGTPARMSDHAPSEEQPRAAA